MLKDFLPTGRNIQMPTGDVVSQIGYTDMPVVQINWSALIRECAEKWFGIKTPTTTLPGQN